MVARSRSFVARRVLRCVCGLQRMGQSKYNPIFEFGYTLSTGQSAHMVVTSVAGHILSLDIDPAYAWGKCDPADCFFKAPLVKAVQKVNGANQQDEGAVACA